MAKPAQTLVAGMIAATAMCAAAATESAAQDRTLVLNSQLQLGDVISGQTLNVVDPSEQVTVSNATTGNSLSGSVDNAPIDLQSTQTLRGGAHAMTTLNLGGDTAGEVNSVTQASGNALAGGAYGSDLSIDAVQTTAEGEITAGTHIPGGTARLLAGGSVDVAATANTLALAGSGGGLTGSVSQTSDTSVRASNLAETSYIPAAASFASQALGNAVSVNGESVSHQNLAIAQRSTGAVIEADTSANAGNAWDLAGQANATANHVHLYNQGGSVVALTDQDNASQVRSTAIVTSYDFGAANAHAQGAGNMALVGNDDVYVQIDNTQLNSGGVEVRSSFAGTNGYDAYVTAEAVGNSVTGYACSACQGVLVANNAQTNSGGVSATATTTIHGSGRAVITGVNAVGNAATFYVTRPGH